MSQRRDQHLFDSGPKRILALDGGGVRGLITLGILERAEAILALRSANPQAFRLCHYFDLIGGTSTGGIIASLLALGLRVSEIREIYLRLCPKVFHRSSLLAWLSNPMGLYRPLFKAANFAKQIDAVIGDVAARAGVPSDKLTLDSDLLQTGLAVVTKRIDRGSVWVMTNNPRSMYWDPQSPYWPDHANRKDWIANKDFALRHVVRATASAPYFLDAIEIPISADQQGLFLDGGASPHNCPAKELFVMTTLKRFSDDGAKTFSPFGFDWDTGADRLLLLSIGTGTWRSTIAPKDYLKKWNLQKALYSLASVIDDGMKSSITWLQALSAPAQPYPVDVQLGDMRGMRIVPEPLLTFRHVNLTLQRDWLKDEFGLDYSDAIVEQLRNFDNSAKTNLRRLGEIGKEAGDRLIGELDFPKQFDVAV
jgi:uncharacterized protein